MPTDLTILDDDARDEFLGTAGTGVLSLSTGDAEPPYSLPVSYGYDPVEEVFYFRLSTDLDSEKGDLANRSVSFVVHDYVDDHWSSVVATGSLVSTTDDSVALEALQGLERVNIPIVDVFEKPINSITFEFYRLDPTTLTARREIPRGQ